MTNLVWNKKFLKKLFFLSQGMLFLWTLIHELSFSMLTIDVKMEGPQ